MAATLTRGATVLTTAKNPRELGRFDEGGPTRSAVTSLAGTPVVTEFVNSQARRRLRLRYELLTEAEASTLRTILDGTGPAELDLGRAGDPVTVVVISSKLEAIIGDYPETAPSGLRYHRAELELALME